MADKTHQELLAKRACRVVATSRTRPRFASTRSVAYAESVLVDANALEFDEAELDALTTVLRNRPKVEAPVAIADVGLAGVPVPAAAGALSPACRSDLVQVNDVPVAVRIVGTAAEARSGLAITPCAGAIALARQPVTGARFGCQTWASW